MSPSGSRDSPGWVASRDRHKMRKPAVEKLRRDRINGCIEQLKLLLEDEFHQRDPDAKLEKADVLEMTVGFLRRRLPRPRDAGCHSRCREETLHFLSAGSPHEATRLRHPVVLEPPPVWRPW